MMELDAETRAALGYARAPAGPEPGLRSARRLGTYEGPEIQRRWSSRNARALREIRARVGAVYDPRRRRWRFATAAERAALRAAVPGAAPRQRLVRCGACGAPGHYAPGCES